MESTHSPTNQSEVLVELISDATTRVIESVAQVGIIPLLMLCGVTMNVINMVVFLRQGLSDRVNLCLFSLAISDCGYILFFSSARLYSILGLVNLTLGQYWKVLSMRLIGIYVAFLNVSNCLTLIISMERCVCVLWPLKAKTAMSTRLMARLIIVVSLVVFVGCGIHTLKYDIATFQDPATNATSYKIRVSRFYLENVDVIDGFAYVFSITMPTVTLAVVMTSTIVITLRMRTVMAWRQQSSHASATATSDQREVAMTRMLAVICIMFTVTTIPYVARVWVTAFVMEIRTLGARYENVTFLSAVFCHIIAITNSSVNFIVYYSMSTRFRKTLKEMVARKRETTSTKHVNSVTMSETLVSE